MSRLQDADVVTPMLKNHKCLKITILDYFQGHFTLGLQILIFRFLGQQRRWENTSQGVSLSKTFPFFQFFFFLARAYFLEHIFLAQLFNFYFLFIIIIIIIA